MRIFGSVARGKADEKSDIDFLVDLEQSHDLLDPAELTMDLRELFGCVVNAAIKRILSRARGNGPLKRQ